MLFLLNTPQKIDTEYTNILSHSIFKMSLMKPVKWSVSYS